MGRIYVNPIPDPDSDEPEDNPVTSGRIYVGSSDADGKLLEVLDTDGEPTTGALDPSDPNAGDGDDEPAGNASREEWADYARTQGATDEDLVDGDGKELGRDALREKYSSKQ